MNKNELPIAALAAMGIKNVEIAPFLSDEDGEAYDVWRVESRGGRYVLKRAKGRELGIYSAFFADGSSGAPRFYAAAEVDGVSYFLMEYVEGHDLCRCDREGLTAALDALIVLQKRYWCTDEQSGIGLSFSEALSRRIDRGRYLGDAELEAAYSRYIERFKSAPRTLCHDDLLPFNVLVSERRATLIDWEVAGILPYLTPLARLIAHAREDEDAFFYMKKEDKAFAVDYYYENLAKEKGISREEYLRDIDLFLLYEYCEWIMLGVKYEDADMERYREYYALAKAHLKRI